RYGQPKPSAFFKRRRSAAHSDHSAFLIPTRHPLTSEECSMASMNKPALNSASWYTDVTNNWTSIETDLIDETLLPAKADLLRATRPSSRARPGVWSDAQVLVADSTQSTGRKWGDDNSIGAFRTVGTHATTQTSISNATFEDMDGMSMTVNVSAAQKVLVLF